MHGASTAIKMAAMLCIELSRAKAQLGNDL
jgi:hypothetical protein